MLRTVPLPFFTISTAPAVISPITAGRHLIYISNENGLSQKWRSADLTSDFLKVRSRTRRKGSRVCKRSLVFSSVWKSGYFEKPLVTVRPATYATGRERPVVRVYISGSHARTQSPNTKITIRLERKTAPSRMASDH